MGKGSVFSVEIPLIPRRIDTNEILKNKNNIPKSSEISTNKKPNILLVEDDSINRNVTKYFLKDICNLEIAKTGESALEFIKTKKYDLILMDIALGQGLNGLETTRLIRENKDYKNVPVIALTAYAMYIEKDRFLDGGCNDYLSKPFTKAELVNKVSQAIQILKN